MPSQNVSNCSSHIDFSKAYDKVPRLALIRTLARLGCGYVMMVALSCLYTDTKLILGAAAISATLGLRQGSPTSCFLFTLYINDLVRDIKEICGLDGYLGWVHSLLLMDDTILLATSRKDAIRKIAILHNFCESSGMVINMGKTKFMVVNGTEQDREKISVADLTVENCDSYTYLGAIFTQDGSVDSTVKAHLKAKQRHIMKFVSFVSKNVDFPFWVKRKVFDSALMSAILYGCEAWIGTSARHAQKDYNTGVKALLGVRTSTPNDICLTELNLPSVAARVISAQQKLVNKLLNDRKDITDDPFMAVWNLCSVENTRGIQYLRSVLSGGDHIILHIETRKQSIRNSIRTKSRTYSEINPELSLHPLYTDPCCLPEFQRLVATRLRVSSHNLAVETGRWAGIPRDSRLCTCGTVQTEEHYICFCPNTADIRARFPFLDFSNIVKFFSNRDLASICKVSYDCLSNLY